ncbi:MAG: hypothetical protein LBE46_03660 [Wolbachia pipientis]|jgi:hypothetical protein|nr:hypothetical protein [Wolbachia pipientis]
MNLTSKKNDEEEKKDELQSKVSAIEQDIKKRKRLWQDIENLKVKLNNLFPQRLSNSQKESAERGKLLAVINHLKQELTLYKKNAELWQELVTLETEVTTLMNDIAKLATEETVDNSLQKKIEDIIKRLGVLQLQGTQLDLFEGPAEKGKLRAAADNLKQKLAQLKQSTGSEKVALGQLTTLKQEQQIWKVR